MTTGRTDSPPTHLLCEGVSFSFSDRRVLTDLSLTAASGQRLGVVGENGCGKSTLLRLLAGLLTPASGTIRVSGPDHPRAGLYHQVVPFAPEESLGQAIESAVANQREAIRGVTEAGERLAARPDDVQATRDYERALAEAERLDAWTVDARIGQTLSSLGLASINPHRPTGSLSGGQRSRLALAWLLLDGPDVLLLDEPTNHLDDSAAEYLASMLKNWRGPVVTASHDRAFLDDIATAIFDMDPSVEGFTRFGGTYSQYLQQQARLVEAWKQRYEREQRELGRLRANVRRSHAVGHSSFKPRSEVRMAAKFYADRNASTVSRRVKSARKQLDELEASQVRKPPSPLTFAALPGRSGAPEAAQVEAADLNVTGLRVAGRLSPVSFTLGAGQKLLITGANGSGKSTLLAAIAGLITPDGGRAATGATIGLLGQDVHLPDPVGRGPGRTARQAYEDAAGPGTPDLAAFGLLAARDHNRAVSQLSTGQQRRLELAILLAGAPGLLLLDEPTNHFSLRLLDELEAAIARWPGSVIVASHDRWLRRQWTGLHVELTAVGQG